MKINKYIQQNRETYSKSHPEKTPEERKKDAKRFIIFDIVFIICFVVYLWTSRLAAERDALLEQEALETAPPPIEVEAPKGEGTVAIREIQPYTSKEEVAAYIHEYKHLPPNYVTKEEAEKQGWKQKEGSLSDALPGKSIGGSHFGNYEGVLPKGHNYYECDIDYVSGSRNAKRIVYTDDDDPLIYYTEDHYETFEQLY